MALSLKDIGRFGPDAQRQILEQVSGKTKGRDPKRARLPTAMLPRAEFDSDLEYEFYAVEVFPRIQRGEIKAMELHREFELYPADEYGGIKLPRNVYKPDFYLVYASGLVEVVETKGHKIRQLQRDYPLRRRLFIEKWCKPKGWAFREIIHDSEPSKGA